MPPVFLSIPPQGEGEGEQETEQTGCGLQCFTGNTKLGTPFLKHDNNSTFSGALLIVVDDAGESKSVY